MAKFLLARDEASFTKSAAQLVLESITLAITERGRAVLALSGGSTPKKLFSLLSDDYYRGRIDWPKLYLFWVDERCVPPHHADSNYGMTKEVLLSRVPIPEKNIHRMRGEMQPPHEAARAYESELRAFFNQEYSIPMFDLVLLGMGEDGHTASLFPGTEALNETDHWVVANHVSRLSSNRLTLTFPILNQSRRVLFLCSGTSKADMLKEIFRESEGKARYPAQRIQPASGDLIWLFDPPAVSKLSDEKRFTLTHL